MRILDRAVYVGPSLYAHFPVIRLEVDLGPLEAWPSGQARTGLHRPPDRGAAGAARARVLLRRAGRVHPAAPRGRGHLDGAHPRARGHRAAERRRRAGDLRQDPRRRRGGALPRHLPVRAGGRRPRGRPPGHHPAPLAAAARAPARGLGARRLRLRRRARRVHPVRPAARAGAEHDGARAGGGGAPDPVDPPQRAEPDPVRPRPVPAADPGHDHEPHVAHRGRARLRQGGDQPHPRPPRPAGAAAAARPAGGRRGRGGRTDRLPRGGEAVQRQPRPRHLDPSRDRGAGAHGVRGGARAQPERDHRELHRRRRSPDAGGERRAGGGVEAGARARRGRRGAHHRAADGGGEPRSAPRHRPREGADPAGVRPPGRDPAGQEGLHAGHGAGRRRAGLPALDRQPLDRRHRHRRHRHRASRQRRDGGAGGEGHRARRRRRGLPHDRHHRVLQGHRRRHLRDQRRARLPDAHGPERRPRRATWPARRSTCCSRRARPAGSRSPR